MGEKKEVILYVDELESEIVSGIPFCRICHEIEFESFKSLEAPCSCSGSVKFAHRDCIQRWCDEKGNTTCEICLQNFEPGYTTPIKKVRLLDAVVTIRGSLEVPRRERRQEHPDLEATRDEEELLESESSSDDRRWNYFRVIALIFTLLLLMRHLLTLLTGETEDYPFTLLTLLIAKTSGIVLPMYVMIRIVQSIHNSFKHGTRHQYEDLEDESSNSESEEDDQDEEQHNHLEHRVDIHTL
ncbi:Zinc finger, RING-CH-type [Heracleum sosnowskyi]|uniref:Zinc finger, RING-CH-type n=1 Tax=Heracleum sosnowskyi TaxID=360622 RepID=A0AAD8GY61_9APIA|nr:Zinc finger, RING-CH-type [Heracleum sosnowskyi]